MPQWTAGISALPPGLPQIGQADRDDQKRFEPFAQGDDERLQHDGLVSADRWRLME